MIIRRRRGAHRRPGRLRREVSYAVSITKITAALAVFLLVVGFLLQAYVTNS